MTEIDAEIWIDADPKRVWGTISDLESEPRYWKGTKSVKETRRDGNTVYRTAVIAFKDSECRQRITLYPEMRIHTEFLEGIIVGTKTLEIVRRKDGVMLRARWEIRFSGAMGIFSGMIKKHVRAGTRQALEAIKAECES